MISWVQRKLTTTNILVFIGITNLLFIAAIFSYIQYTNQIADQYRNATNTTATQIKFLINAIDKSDKADESRIKTLLETNNLKSDRNYLALVNSTNQTNNLVQFLSDNFGADSDYLVRENFQYDQANKTYQFVKKTLENQDKRILKNQELGIKTHQEIIGLLRNLTS